MSEPFPEVRVGGNIADGRHPSPEAATPRGSGEARPPRSGTPEEPIDSRLAARRVVRRLLAVSLASIAVTAVVYVLTVGTALGQLVGELILGGRTGAPEAVRAAEDVLRTTSRAALAAGGVTAVAFALLQRREALAAVAGGTVILANLTTQVLKGAVLDRTDLLDNLFYFLPNSFPSGHVTAAASLAVVLLLVLPPILRSPTVILGSIGVAVVGASTLIAGWHRMADAVGGVFVATAWGAGLTAILVWRRGVEPVGRRTADLARSGSALPLAVGVVILLIGAGAYLVAIVDPLGVLLYLAERGGSPALLAVGVLITTGSSFLALGAFGLTIRDVRLDPRRRAATTAGPADGGAPGAPTVPEAAAPPARNRSR